MSTSEVRPQEYASAYIIDRHWLTDFNTALTQISGQSPLYKISCSDKSSVTFAGLHDLLGFHNVKGRRITELHVTSLDNGTCYVEASFTQSLPKPIRTLVRGHAATVSHASEQINGFITRCAQWYSAFALARAWSLAAGAFVGLLVGYLVLTSGWYVARFGLAANIARTVILWSSCVTAIALAILLYMRATLFPIGIFALGDGRRQLIRILFWRYAVLLAFALGVASSVVATWLTNGA